MFPYAQKVNPRAVRSGDLRSSVNYVRNSVKVVIDAYDGTPEFYIVDDRDPIAKSYRQQFPDLFTDAAPPQELAEHFRYPEDLFRMQTDMWGRYRITEASEFYDAAALGASLKIQVTPSGKQPGICYRCFRKHHQQFRESA